MTERDIEGNILILVNAYKLNEEFENEMTHREMDRETRAKKKKEIKENQTQMENAATELVITLFTDFHRIADALELLASRSAK